MEYKLAKELRDAGFMQDSSVSIEPPDTRTVHIEDSGCYCPRCIEQDYVWCPSLSELIEACGENFSALEKRNRSEASIEERRWYTWQHELVDGKWVKYDGEGSTPEEAVSRLWLALNSIDKKDRV